MAHALAFVSSARMVEHETGDGHPERQDRIRAIHRAIRLAGIVSSPDPFPEFEIDLGLNDIGVRAVEMEAKPAPVEYARLVHTDRHVELVRSTCAAGGGALDADTQVCSASFDVALLSLGSAVVAADAVMSGFARRAFSAARPPGHHAEPDRPMGFCLFSNAAIVAKYIQKSYGLRRVAIVDFDVHHGNGTQACLERDDSVLFVSLHQSPETCYPGTGHAGEVGIGAGRGYTVNLPMEPGSGDADYQELIRTRVVPELDQFRPEVLLLSAGFDAHRDDPLAEMQVSDDGFAMITSELVRVADRHCDGRVISLLEGGYNLRALGRSVVRHLEALAK